MAATNTIVTTRYKHMVRILDNDFINIILLSIHYCNFKRASTNQPKVEKRWAKSIPTWADVISASDTKALLRYS